MENRAGWRMSFCVGVGLFLSLVGACVWVASHRLSVDLVASHLVPVMQVTASESGSVILPSLSVQFDNDQAFVLVVDDKQVAQLQTVQATSWRDNYYRVEGLKSDELVILEDVPIGAKLSYNLINPEAGQSGVIER